MEPRARKLPRGVYQLSGSQRYTVIISIGGKKTNFGAFDNVEMAREKAQKIWSKLDYHNGNLPRSWLSMSTDDSLAWLLNQPKHQAQAELRAQAKRRRKRKHFSEANKAATLLQQNHLCGLVASGLQYAGCTRQLLPDRFEFDHKDGDRSNNVAGNCQALCVVCHTMKSRRAACTQ